MRNRRTPDSEFVRLASVVGDCHAQHGETPEDFERHSALGVFLAKIKPERHINGGDQGDFSSLNKFKGSSLMGGDGGGRPNKKTTIRQDEDAFCNSLAEHTRYIELKNNQHKRSRRSDRCHLMDKDLLLGNHENYLDLANYKHYGLKDTVSSEYIRSFAAEKGYNVHGFNNPVEIAGTLFCHFLSGQTGKALALNSIPREVQQSSFTFHTHKPGIIITVTPTGRRITNIVGPCFKPYRMLGPKEDSGIMLLKNMEAGEFSFENVRLSEILEEYRDWKMEARQRNTFGRKYQSA